MHVSELNTILGNKILGIPSITDWEIFSNSDLVAFHVEPQKAEDQRGRAWSVSRCSGCWWNAPTKAPFKGERVSLAHDLASGSGIHTRNITDGENTTKQTKPKTLNQEPSIPLASYPKRLSPSFFFSRSNVFSQKTAFSSSPFGENVLLLKRYILPTNSVAHLL